MLPVVAIVIVLACVAASAVRLKFALVPTALDPGAVTVALASSPRLERPLQWLARTAALPRRASWELALVEALQAQPSHRAALVNEQLTELDYLVQRWVRVPRVCASICTSAGFLLAATVLRDSLAAPPEAMSGAAVDAAVVQAINVAAIGLAGAAFCISIQMRARKAAAATNAAYDRLVEKLERSCTPGHALGRMSTERLEAIREALDALASGLSPQGAIV